MVLWKVFHAVSGIGNSGRIRRERIGRKKSIQMDWREILPENDHLFPRDVDVVFEYLAFHSLALHA